MRLKRKKIRVKAKHVLVTIVGLLGYAFYVVLALLTAPYLNTGLYYMIFAPYKPFLQFEWAGKYDFYSIVLFTSLYILLLIVIYIRSRKVRQGEEYGSMKYESPAKLERKYADRSDEYKNRIMTSGIRMNENMQKIGRTLNCLVEGGPGTWKSRGFVLPNILQMIESGASAFVVDPKGELLANTGDALKKHRVKAKVFDVKEMYKSFHYNPFVYIHTVEDAIKVVDNIWASTLTENKSEGVDPFWPGAARAGLLAYVLYLWDFALPEEQNFEMVFYVFDKDEPVENGKSAVGKLFDILKKENPNHPALFWYNIMHSGTDDMQRSVRAVFSERLKYFSTPAVLELTRNDELDITGMVEEQTVLFCITPITNRSFNFLVSLLFMQMIDELYLYADKKYNSKLPRHFHFLIDEFYKFRVDVENFQGFLSTDRGYNISCSMIIQAYAQLEEIYKKEGAEAIQGYCDEYLFLGSNSIASTEHVSKMLGNETINTSTYGFQFGGRGGSSSNHQQAKRELLDPNELRILNNRKALFFLRGEYPVLDDKYNIYDHPYSKDLGEKTGEFYDHGKAKNDLVLDSAQDSDEEVKIIDVEITGSAAKNIRYFTDEEINMLM